MVENLAADVTRVRLTRAPDDAPVTTGGTRARGTRAKAERKRAAPEAANGETPKAIELLYFVDGAGLFAAAGVDPRDSLRALVQAPSGANLATNAPMAGALAAVGAEATFVLVADAQRISAMTGGSALPATPGSLVIAVGRSGAPAELWGRVDLPSAVAQQLVQEYTRPRAATPAASP